MECTLEKKIICNKHDIILKRLSPNYFSINFSCHNENYDLSKLVDFNLYTLMAKLNTDLIDKIKIYKADDKDINSRKILFLFKSLGKELGLSPKYMHLSTKYIKCDNKIVFNSVSIPKKNSSKYNKYEKLTCNHSELAIIIENQHVLNVEYNFNIDLHEDLPIYMENMIGILMKKVFYRLKIFIEKMHL